MKNLKRESSGKLIEANLKKGGVKMKNQEKTAQNCRQASLFLFLYFILLLLDGKIKDTSGVYIFIVLFFVILVIFPFLSKKQRS